MKTRTKLIIIFLVSVWSINYICAAQSNDDTTKIKSLYMAQLQTCSQKEFEKSYEYPFLSLLNKENKKEYLALKDLEQKKTYIEFYWKQRDPNPLLAGNEFLHDFIRRYYYIKEHFSYPKAPYFDDRGKFYLRYGEPSYRFQEQSQVKNANLFRSPQIRHFLGAVLNNSRSRRLIIPKEYTVQGNETWVYKFIPQGEDKELIINFVADGDFFREVQTLEEAIIYPRQSKLKYFYWADLIKERATAIQSRMIFDIQQQIIRFDQDIMQASLTMIDKGTTFDITKPHLQLRQMNNTLSVNVKRIKARTPTTLSAPGKAIQRLTFLYDIIQFKGSEDATKLSINYFTPFSHRFSDSLMSFGADTVSMEYAYLFENKKLERVKKNIFTRSYSLQNITQQKLPYIIENSYISLPAQKGRMTLQVKNETTQRIGFAKHDMTLRDFSNDDLCVSDIQFCRNIDDSLKHDYYPIIQKRGIKVIPYPYKKIHNTEQLFCYFEIYNIKKSGIESQYEIAIEVTTAKQKKGLFKKIFGGSPEKSISIDHTRDVIDDDSQELLGIDFSNLEKGNYTLSIRVTDKDNKDITALVTRELEIESY